MDWRKLIFTFFFSTRFHRNQPVFVESKENGKTSGVIASVGTQEVCTYTIFMLHTVTFNAASPVDARGHHNQKTWVGGGVGLTHGNSKALVDLQSRWSHGPTLCQQRTSYFLF